MTGRAYKLTDTGGVECAACGIEVVDRDYRMPWTAAGMEGSGCRCGAGEKPKADRPPWAKSEAEQLADLHNRVGAIESSLARFTHVQGGKRTPLLGDIPEVPASTHEEAVRQAVPGYLKNYIRSAAHDVKDHVSAVLKPLLDGHWKRHAEEKHERAEIEKAIAKAQASGDFKGDTMTIAGSRKRQGSQLTPDAQELEDALNKRTEDRAEAETKRRDDIVG